MTLGIAKPASALLPTRVRARRVPPPATGVGYRMERVLGSRAPRQRRTSALFALGIRKRTASALRMGRTSVGLGVGPLPTSVLGIHKQRAQQIDPIILPERVLGTSHLPVDGIREGILGGEPRGGHRLADGGAGRQIDLVAFGARDRG